MEIINKIYKHIKKYILIYTGIYILLFIGLCITLPLYELKFRSWINIVSIVIIIGGIVVGVLQLLMKIKIKAIKYVLVSFFCIIALISSIYIHIIFAFIGMFDSEYVIKADEKKYVAKVSGWMGETIVKYYGYKNIFVSENKLRIYRSRVWFF